MDEEHWSGVYERVIFIERDRALTLTDQVVLAGSDTCSADSHMMCAERQGCALRPAAGFRISAVALTQRPMTTVARRRFGPGAAIPARAKAMATQRVHVKHPGLSPPWDNLHKPIYAYTLIVRTLLLSSKQTLFSMCKITMALSAIYCSNCKTNKKPKHSY